MMASAKPKHVVLAINLEFHHLLVVYCLHCLPHLIISNTTGMSELKIEGNMFLRDIITCLPVQIAQYTVRSEFRICDLKFVSATLRSFNKKLKLSLFTRHEDV
jgi:hypothetical protein